MMVSGEASFTCPRCGLTSYLPGDVAEGYCCRCHAWTGQRCSGYTETFGQCALLAGHDGSHRIVWVGEDGEHVVTWSPDLERLRAARRP